MTTKKAVKHHYPIEYVEWDDHYSVDAWTEIAEHDNTAMKVISVGYLIKEDKKAITLALNIGDGGKTVSCAMIIIKAQIIKRQRMKGLK